MNKTFYLSYKHIKLVDSLFLYDWTEYISRFGISQWYNPGTVCNYDLQIYCQTKSKGIKSCYYGLYLKIRINLVYSFILAKLSLKILAIRKNAIEKGCVTYVCLVQRDEGEGGGGLGPFFRLLFIIDLDPSLLEPQRVSQNRFFFQRVTVFLYF